MGVQMGYCLKFFKTYLAIAITTQNVKTINVRLFGNAPIDIFKFQNKKKGAQAMKDVVLVTGATGFVGSHIVKKCLNAGHSVRAFVLQDDPGMENLKKDGVEIVIGDLQDESSIRKSFDNIDIVFHTAALVSDWAPKSLFHEVTVQGTRRMCHIASLNKLKRFVYISTNDVFGIHNESIIIDETCPYRYWKEPYPDAKIEAEKIAWEYYHNKNLPLTMVYPCWIFGPGDRTFLPLLADAIYHGEMIFWRRNASVWPTFIDNLTDLLMTIAYHPNAVGNGYIVHDGESISFQDFCTRIAIHLKLTPPRIHIPYSLAYLTAMAMEAIWKALQKKERPLLTTYAVKNLGARMQYSILKAEHDLEWTPKIKFDQGFELAMEWLKTLNIDNIKHK